MVYNKLLFVFYIILPHSAKRLTIYTYLADFSTNFDRDQCPVARNKVRVVGSGDRGFNNVLAQSFLCHLVC